MYHSSHCRNCLPPDYTFIRIKGDPWNWEKYSRRGLCAALELFGEKVQTNLVQIPGPWEHVWSGAESCSADTQHSGRGSPSAHELLHSAVKTHETQSGPPSCDTVHGRMNNIAFPSLVGLQALGERLPESYPAVRKFSGTRNWLCGRRFFHRPGKEGWFKLFICCAPYFHCYCISSTSDLHTLDLGGWGLLYKTRSLYFSSASSLFTFSPPTTRMPGTQCIGGDSKPHLSLATYDGDFCISSSSHGNYSHTWKLGRQSVHVLSMWLSAYVCTSFFRKFYFTLQQLDE